MITRTFALLTLLLSLLWGEQYKVDHFTADIFSKEGNKLKKVEMTLLFEGEDLSKNSYKLLDALNVIISSFYVEDLFTSKGKERFKQMLRQYVQKKYMLDIDFIYILKLDLQTPVDIDKLLERLNALQQQKGLPPTKPAAHSSSLRLE